MVWWPFSRAHWGPLKSLHAFQKALDHTCSNSRTHNYAYFKKSSVISEMEKNLNRWHRDIKCSQDCLNWEYMTSTMFLYWNCLCYSMIEKKCMFNSLQLSMQCWSAARTNNSKRLMFEHILQHNRIKGESSSAAISNYWSKVIFGTLGLVMLPCGNQANHEG